MITFQLCLPAQIMFCTIYICKHRKLVCKPSNARLTFTLAGSSSTFTSQDASSSSGSSAGSDEEGQSSSKPSSSNRGVNIRGPEQSGWLTGKPAQNVETPQVVVDRIFSRMVTFSVAPVSLGIAFLGVFYYLKVGAGCIVL